MALTDTLWSNWMGCSPWLSGPWKWKSSRRPNYESPTLASDEPFRVLIHPLTGFDWAVLRLSVIDHWKDRLRDNQRRSGVARRGNRCLTGDRVATSRQTLSPQTPSRLVHGHKINVPDADAAALQMINRALSHARSKKSGLTRFSLFKGSTFHRERNQRISRFRLSYKTYNFFFCAQMIFIPIWCFCWSTICDLSRLRVEDAENSRALVLLAMSTILSERSFTPTLFRISMKLFVFIRLDYGSVSRMSVWILGGH